MVIRWSRQRRRGVGRRGDSFKDQEPDGVAGAMNVVGGGKAVGVIETGVGEAQMARGSRR